MPYHCRRFVDILEYAVSLDQSPGANLDDGHLALVRLDYGEGDRVNEHRDEEEERVSDDRRADSVQ